MVIRRAGEKDIKGIKQLIQGGFGRDEMDRALQRRYGDYNLAFLIDTCPISLLVTADDGKIEGFIALSFAPPVSLPLAVTKDFDGNTKLFSLYDNQWNTWLADCYKVSNAKIHNSVFINFFCGAGEEQSQILESLFRVIFEMNTMIQNIGFFLPESLIMFPPFSSPRPAQRTEEMKKQVEVRQKRSKLSSHFFTECPSFSHCVMPFSFHVCQRKDFYAEFQVRRARVEDCDDIIPILKKNKLLRDDQGDYYMSELLEQNSKSVISIVGEIDGQVVAFMCADRNTDQNKLREAYDLKMFDQLAKIGPQVAEGDVFIQTEMQMELANTFHITLFCIDPQYSAFSDNLLAFVFNLWTDLDFCALTVPETAPVSPILRYFSSVPRKQSLNEHMLYVTNRYCLEGQLEVVKTTKVILSKVLKLLQPMENADELVDAIKEGALRDSEQMPIISFAGIFNGQVIGVVLLEYCSPEKDRAIVDQFDIEFFLEKEWAGMDNNYSIVKHVVINPLFEKHSRYFFREILRQLKNYCLVLPANMVIHDEATKRIALREFTPVKPRRMVQYPNNLRDGEPVPDKIHGNLQILTMPQIEEPRMIVNTPIVVVGGSDTGISFLEKFIYANTSHKFHQPGVNFKRWKAKVGLRCGFYHLKQIAIDYYVKIVEDMVVQIHRSEKIVSLKSGSMKFPCKVRYEYLILTPGLQYNISNLNAKMGSLLGGHPMNISQFKNIMPHLNMLAKNDKLGKIVIYGSGFEAYQTVEYCLSIGIDSSRIHFFDPSNRCLLFPEPELQNIALEHLKNTGIQYYKHHVFSSHEEYEDKIAGINFLDPTNKRIFITGIGVFLHAEDEKIDPISFKAINDANLVFDESMVIDNCFRTKDPYVFGAGTCTRYSVDLESSWKQKYCNSKEVGNRLGWLLLHLFDPNMPLDASVLDLAVNDYTKPMKTLSRLPGGLLFFHYDIPHLLNHKHSPNRRDLVITNSTDEYCRIRVDPKGYIFSFTYLGHREIPVDNMGCLYQRHEKFFNRLVSRFDEGVIPDFIKFFEETWALVMFYDRFPVFINSLLTDAETKDDIKEIVQKMETSNHELTNSEKEGLYEEFEKSNTRDEWDNSIFEYLLKTKIFKSYP